MLDVFAAVVADHHLVGHHQRLHETLCADGAPPSPPRVVAARVVGSGCGGCSGRGVAAVFDQVCQSQSQGQTNQQTKTFEEASVAFIRTPTFTAMNSRGSNSNAPRVFGSELCRSRLLAL